MPLSRSIATKRRSRIRVTIPSSPDSNCFLHAFGSIFRRGQDRTPSFHFRNGTASIGKRVVAFAVIALQSREIVVADPDQVLTGMPLCFRNNLGKDLMRGAHLFDGFARRRELGGGSGSYKLCSGLMRVAPPR